MFLPFPREKDHAIVRIMVLKTGPDHGFKNRTGERTGKIKPGE
jgi:hypothetical protein